MSDKINNVAVIGAGVMGAGIAGVFAKNDTVAEVILLDADQVRGEKTIEGADIARNAIKKLIDDKVITKHQAEKFKFGSTNNSLDLIKNSDLITEVITENPEVKRELFQKIEGLRKTDSIVTSNTSSLKLESLEANQSYPIYATHYFNPPTSNKLVELASGPKGNQEDLNTLSEFLGKVAEKTVIPVKDQPGFAGNRIGTGARMKGLIMALEMDVPLEIADAVVRNITGGGMGPAELTNFIGIKDKWDNVLNGFKAGLPNDEFYQNINMPTQIREMMESGLTLYKKGEKGKKLVIDPTTKEYHPIDENAVNHVNNLVGFQALLNDNTKAGEYARAWVTMVTEYAAKVSNDIAYKPEDVDSAYKIGYTASFGPNEIAQRAKDSYSYQFLKISVDENGVANVVLNRPKVRNAVNKEFMDEISHAFQKMDQDDKIKGVVLSGAGDVFSAGADKKWMSAMVNYTLEENIQDCSHFNNMLASIHGFKKWVIADVQGASMGGGIGLQTSCDFIVAQKETAKSKDAKFAYKEGELGILPAMIGGLSVLRIGIKNALNLFKSGKEIGTEDALKCGLIDIATENRKETVNSLVNEVLNCGMDGKEYLRKKSEEIHKNRIDLPAFTNNLPAFMNTKMEQLVYGISMRLGLKMDRKKATSKKMQEFVTGFTAEARMQPTSQSIIRMSLEKFNHIEVKIDPNGIAQLKLKNPKDKPDNNNALTEGMMVEVKKFFDLLNEKPHKDHVKAVVISGDSKGKGFSSGGSLDWMRNSKFFTQEENLAENTKNITNMDNMMSAVLNCKVPTIAKVDGFGAVGAAAAVAAACDHVVMEMNEKAKIVFPEAKFEMPAAIVVPYIVDRVGEENSRIILNKCRVLSPTMAKDCGLVDEVKSPDEMGKHMDDITKTAILFNDKERFKNYSRKSHNTVTLDAEHPKDFNIAATLLEKSNDLINKVLDYIKLGKKADVSKDITIPYTSQVISSNEVQGLLDIAYKAKQQPNSERIRA